MTDELTFHLSPSKTGLPATNQPQMVYLLIEIQPGDGLGEVNLPVNLSLVVDRSQSMCIPILTEDQFKELVRRGSAHEMVVDGVPVWEFRNVPAEMTANSPCNLDFVKTALRSALEQLSPRDRFSLVAFAARAQTLVSNQPGTNKRRLLDAIEKLDRLQLGDETRMAQGMALGYQEAARSLSPDVVTRMVLLTDGFTADSADCLVQAKAAAGQHVTVSTVGLGVEFNEELMIDIADSTRGNAYFIRNPQEIPDVFKRELNGVQAIVLRNLELKLALIGGVELRKAYRVRPVISDLGRIAVTEGSASIPLGDLGRKAPQAVLLELVAPPRQPGRYRLAQFVLAYDNPARSLLGQKERAEFVVEYGAGAEPDPQVMSLVEKVTAHTLQTRALDEARAGNVVGATTKLQAAYTRLLAAGEAELAQTTLQEIDNLQRQGQLSPGGTKRLRYETRRLES